MDRVEEPTDEDEVSFARPPSPDEARARLAALRGKPLDAPSRLAVVEEDRAEPAVEPDAAAPAVPAIIPAAAAALNSGLSAETVAALLKLLEDTAPKAEPQKAAKADKALFRVKKVRITTRIDADVLEAFKATGPGYQTLMNDVLRANMPGS